MKIVVDLNEEQIETLKKAIGAEDMIGYDFEDADSVAEAVDLLLHVLKELV